MDWRKFEKVIDEWGRAKKLRFFKKNNHRSWSDLIIFSIITYIYLILNYKQKWIARFNAKCAPVGSTNSKNAVLSATQNLMTTTNIASTTIRKKSSYAKNAISKTTSRMKSVSLVMLFWLRKISVKRSVIFVESRFYSRILMNTQLIVFCPLNKSRNMNRYKRIIRKKRNMLKIISLVNIVRLAFLRIWWLIILRFVRRRNWQNLLLLQSLGPISGLLWVERLKKSAKCRKRYFMMSHYFLQIMMNSKYWNPHK